jgi:hypothetical protein
VSTGDERDLRRRGDEDRKYIWGHIVICELIFFCTVAANLDLKPHAGSDRAFTYFTPDWSEDPETGKVEQQNELFAFRFANPENAGKFKDAFVKCQKGESDDMPIIKQDAEDAEKVSASSKEYHAESPERYVCTRFEIEHVTACRMNDKEQLACTDTFCTQLRAAEGSRSTAREREREREREARSKVRQNRDRERESASALCTQERKQRECTGAHSGVKQICVVGRHQPKRKNKMKEEHHGADVRPLFPPPHEDVGGVFQVDLTLPQPISLAHTYTLTSSLPPSSPPLLSPPPSPSWPLGKMF